MWLGSRSETNILTSPRSNPTLCGTIHAVRDARGVSAGGLGPPLAMTILFKVSLCAFDNSRIKRFKCSFIRIHPLSSLHKSQPSNLSTSMHICIFPRDRTRSPMQPSNTGESAFQNRQLRVSSRGDKFDAALGARRRYLPPALDGTQTQTHVTHRTCAKPQFPSPDLRFGICDTISLSQSLLKGSRASTLILLFSISYFTYTRSKGRYQVVGVVSPNRRN